MADSHRASTKKRVRDKGKTAMTAFLAVAAVAGASMYWVIQDREAPTNYTSSYAPQTESDVVQAASVTRPTTGPLTVMFIGDSITRGSGASAEPEIFQAKVTRSLSESGPVTPIVSAIGGARLQTVADATTISPDTDLAIIELGTNDSGDDPTPLNVFRDQYAALLQKVRASAPEASILCLGVWRRDGANFDGIIRSECNKAGGYSTILRDIVSNPATRGPNGRPVYGAASGIGDNFHPNDVGYTAIADRIMKSLAVA